MDLQMKKFYLAIVGGGKFYSDGCCCLSCCAWRNFIEKYGIVN